MNIRWFASLVFLSVSFAQSPPVWTPDMAMRLKVVSSAVPSPDGAWVAWQQAEAVVDDTHSEILTHLFLGRADGSRRFQLTRGDKSCSSPAFSPDGKYLYFISTRAGAPNLYRISTQAGEAEPLTTWKGEMGVLAVSPDGKTLAFTGRKPDEAAEKRKKEKLDYVVVDDSPANYSLWTVPVEAGAEGKREPKEVVPGKYHITAIDWTPDSKSIVFQHQPTPIVNDIIRIDVSMVNLDKNDVADIAATEASEMQPHVSPDGQYVAIVRTVGRWHWAYDEDVVLIPLKQGGAPRVLASSFDRNPSIVGWTADSKSVLFLESRGTRRVLYSLPLDGAPASLYERANGVVMEATLNSTNTKVAFVSETSATPGEGFVMAATGGAPVQVTAANADVVLPPMPKTDVIRWKSVDGREIEGLLTYPVNYHAGTKVPLVLNIHGGPAGVFQERFIGAASPYPLATFASKGYAVLRCNPRGSSGYGKEFRAANHNDWGGKDYQDLMAGVDHVIAMGVADPDHMAVMGWSYGGFMTSWVITQTNRFKAAAVGAGVTDLWSFTGTTDIGDFLPDYFGGEPWQVLDTYRAHSPITYANKVKTPTLILHGQADDRVPLTQGEEYYRALVTNGTTVKMVTYPRTPHGPREPKFVRDLSERHLDWVERYAR